MQHMFGNDPKFQQAMKMAQGKTPDQLKETAFNLAKTQGIDPKQIMGVLSNFGIKNLKRCAPKDFDLIN